MQRQLFPDLGVYDIPDKSSYGFPIRLNKFGAECMRAGLHLPRTNVNSLKKDLSRIQRKKESESFECQADFQEEFVRQLEAEVLKEPTMAFLKVDDIGSESSALIKPDDPWRVSDFSLGSPIPTQAFEVKNLRMKEAIIEENERELMEEHARDPWYEIEQTHAYKMKDARERVAALEQEAFRLESDMKMQNLQLDRLGLRFDPRMKQEATKEIVAKIVQDDGGTDRVAMILQKNKALYGRIERALTPKIEEIDQPEKEESVSQERFGKRVTSMVSKRISAAIGTASQAIRTSRGTVHPTVLKRPKH